MKLLFMIAFMTILDRVFPFNVRQFGRKFFLTNSEEFYKRYGWISFPRTAFALLACAPAAINYLHPISDTIQGTASVGFVILWGVSAFVDVLRARK